MAPKNTVIIDGERLKNELDKIDKYNSEIARECGYNPPIFRHALTIIQWLDLV